jgi:hypothetical protein
MLSTVIGYTIIKLNMEDIYSVLFLCPGAIVIR